MSKPDSLVFDLDGTLWDTSASCASAWNTSLERLRIPFREITAEDLKRVVGRPHEACIRDTFTGLPEEQLVALIAETKTEDNATVARLGGTLYAGVEAGLRALARRFPLFIVSNCQAGYIETFYRLTGLGPCFRDQECWGHTGRGKPANLAAVIARNGLGSPVYVGDTEGDRAAARECGVPFYFAAYGFGQVRNFDIKLDAFADLLAGLA